MLLATESATIITLLCLPAVPVLYNLSAHLPSPLHSITPRTLQDPRGAKVPARVPERALQHALHEDLHRQEEGAHEATHIAALQAAHLHLLVCAIQGAVREGGAHRSRRPQNRSPSHSYFKNCYLLARCLFTIRFQHTCTGLSMHAYRSLIILDCL